jgi:hypothetical protein
MGDPMLRIDALNGLLDEARQLTDDLEGPEEWTWDLVEVHAEEDGLLWFELSCTSSDSGPMDAPWFRAAVGSNGLALIVNFEEMLEEEFLAALRAI